MLFIERPCCLNGFNIGGCKTFQIILKITFKNHAYTFIYAHGSTGQGEEKWTSKQTLSGQLPECALQGPLMKSRHHKGIWNLCSGVSFGYETSFECAVSPPGSLLFSGRSVKTLNVMKSHSAP